jgi:hypothetical protein
LLHLSLIRHVLHRHNHKKISASCFLLLASCFLLLALSS